MAKKRTSSGSPAPSAPVDPRVAAELTGIIYQARLLNRQAKVNIPEQEIISEVISLWRLVTESLARASN